MRTLTAAVLSITPIISDMSNARGLNFLKSRGVSLRELMDEGVYFVVAEAALKYLSPGRYGDIMAIETNVDRVGPASIVFRHSISRDNTGEKLVEATVKLGCVGKDMKPLRLRQNIMEAVTKADES